MKAKQIKKACKIQSSVEGYTYHVLENLVGIHGTSISDVVSFLIKSWIKDNAKELDSWGLGIKDYRGHKEKIQ